MVKEEIERFRNTTNFSIREVTDFNKTTLKPIFIKLGISVALLFVLVGIYMWVSLENIIFASIFFAFGVVSAIIMPFLYKSVVKKSTKKNVMCSSSTYLDYKFTDGGFYVRTLKGEIEVANQTVDYRWIEKIVESGHYLYIFITSSLCYILDKNGMTVGKSEKLKEFLVAKNIKFVSKNRSKIEPREVSESVKNEEVTNIVTAIQNEEGINLGQVKQEETVGFSKVEKTENDNDFVDTDKTPKIEKLVSKTSRKELTKEEQKRKNALEKMTK